MRRKKVAVGLSGGVDSAVSAWLLKQQGFDVVGVYLYCWPAKSEIRKDKLSRDEWMKKHGCWADEDRQSALKTALELQIPFKSLDFSEEYNNKVIDYFYDEYRKGRTPNPDVLCNSEIKFGLFLDWVLKNKYDYLATGHYAKIKKDKEGLGLFIPEDKKKDQTYFLWKLRQEQLRYVLFPLADYRKKQVRQIAGKLKLSVKNRPDSQGICFVGDINVREFLKRRLKERRGRVVDIKGRVVGEHNGVWFYTVGQRGGWRLDRKVHKDLVKESKTPIMYVVGKNALTNELVVGMGEETRKNVFGVSGVNWIRRQRMLRRKLKCRVRIRHGGKLLDGIVSEDRNKKARVILDESERGVATGQSVVLYNKGECLGGGVIE